MCELCDIGDGIRRDDGIVVCDDCNKKYPVRKTSHKSTFKEREKSIDVADIKFQEYVKCSNKITYCRRYGFDERGRNIGIENFMAIPKFLRASPDFFIISNSKPCFVEVKGCRDVLRLKKDDIMSYSAWNELLIKVSLYFFIYSTQLSKEVVISYDSLVFLIENNHYKVGTYKDNGKQFYNILLEDLFNEKKQKKQRKKIKT